MSRKNKRKGGKGANSLDTEDGAQRDAAREVGAGSLDQEAGGILAFDDDYDGISTLEEEGQFMHAGQNALRPKDPWAADSNDDEQVCSSGWGESPASDEWSDVSDGSSPAEHVFVVPNRFAKSRRVHEGSTGQTAIANKFSPLDPVDETGAISEHGLRLPPMVSPQVPSTTGASGSSARPLFEESRQQHREFQEKTDQLWLAATPSSPPGLQIQVPPVPQSFREVTTKMTTAQTVAIEEPVEPSQKVAQQRDSKEEEEEKRQKDKCTSTQTDIILPGYIPVEWMPMVGGARPRLSSETEESAQKERDCATMQQVVCNYLALYATQNQVQP